jgi:hypothetical protein
MESLRGYDYKCESSRTMKWMKQEFEDKMMKYLGNRPRVKKQTRLEKTLLK